MKILVKFPTRERPSKFFLTLAGYRRRQTTNYVHYMLTLDSDDRTMNNDQVKIVLGNMLNVSYHYGISNSKIDAVNRDMDKAPTKWDICVLASDDMLCQADGWDERIITDMYAHFPDTDGTLFYWDGDKATKAHNAGRGLCTMNIIGRKYYERFGYLYHPSYKSLWCDNEYTEVAQGMDRMVFSEDVLFKHAHFSNTPGMALDKLMKHTQSFYHEDGKNYDARKLQNFPA